MIVLLEFDENRIRFFYGVFNIFGHNHARDELIDLF